ncbi:hypothetical protein ABZ499_33045 [Streptomyces sp. NPDC019990]|uniref:hypothetical protein n=1 Tax=Streptomyces sp. NPDC019990 TaxID=3154693 RepID=UPI0033E14DCA
MPLHRHPAPIRDDHWEGEELARDDTHRYVWLWYGSNIRLIAVPHGPDGDWSLDHAWCFARDPQLVARAVADWDPDTQDEPTGWHKRPTWPVRHAPRRHENPDYNRARCVHGCYLDEGCRTVNCPEVLDHQNRAHTVTPEGTA